jgi:hypothetical protein
MFRATHRPSSGAQKLCSLWFYIRFWLPVAIAEPSQQQPATKKYVKSEAAIRVFELLMMGGVSLETC